LALTRGGQAPFAHGMPAVDNHSVAAQTLSSAAKTNVR
jgi:hypothetical protein